MKHKTAHEIYNEQWCSTDIPRYSEQVLMAQADETNRLLAEIGTVLEDLVLTLQVNRIVDGEDSTAG